jgi:hypothetical protein
MKKTFFTLVTLMIAMIFNVSAQEKPSSPKETVKGSIDGANIEIVYCKPSARGRKMLGEKEPYGQVWRTGANDATIIEFDKNVKIEGKALPKGKYELFTIPGETEWVIIIQKFGKQWGAYSYKDSNDVLRVTVKAGKTPAFVETFSITVDKGAVNLAWENTAVSFKVKGA